MKVLFDVTFAGYPVSGIPNEVALLFEMFATDQQKNVEVDALIHQAISKRMQRLSNTTALQDIAIILARFKAVQDDEPSKIRYMLEILMYLLEIRINKAIGLRRSSYIWMDDNAKDVIFDSLYRVFFERMSKQSSREEMRKRSYLFTRHHYELSLMKANVGAGPEKFRVPQEYDVSINYGVKNILLTGRAKTIHRHVDLIPYEAPDTLGGIPIICKTRHHIKRVLAKSDHVVCVSEEERKKLVVVEPALEGKSNVIPAVIPQLEKRVVSPEFLRNIFTSYNWSLQKMTAGERLGVERRINREFANSEKPVEYICCVSTIEPRKNYVALVRAWEYLRYHKNRNVKLVIVGGLGWHTDKIEPVIMRYARQAEIITLRDVPKFAFEAVLSHAALFVFLSHTEGFGVGPLEALQCETRALVLDRPIYREVYKDSVDYVDNYSSASVGESVLTLLQQRAENPDRFFEEVRLRAERVLSAYKPESVRSKWIETIMGVANKST